MSTNVSNVISHFPSAENGFTTTTSGSVGIAAVTVGLNSVAGYTNGETAVFIIDPSNAKKQTFTGVIDTSGVQVTNVIWTAGSNVAHDAGATVVDYATATHISMVSKGILAHANQDGSLKDNAVTTDTITDASVTNTKLSTSAILLGFANDTALSGTSSTSTVAAGSLSASVTIPAGGRSVKVTVYLTSVRNGTTSTLCYYSLWDGTAGSGTQLAGNIVTMASASQRIPASLVFIHTPSAGAKTYSVGHKVSAGTSAYDTSATSPAQIIIELV
jgi:hypothetical protein